MTRQFSDHPTAVVRREIRDLIRHPPIRGHDALMTVAAVAAGIPLARVYELAGYPERKTIVHWRKTHPVFDRAIAAAEVVQEYRDVARVADLLETGTPATIKAIRWATGCTPREARRWMLAADFGLVD